MTEDQTVDNPADLSWNDLIELPPRRPDDDGQTNESPSLPAANSVSIAALLVAMALDQYELGRTPADSPYVRPLGGHVVRQMRGGTTGLRSHLAKVYFQRQRKIAPSAALTDAIATLEGLAGDAPVREVHLRIAEHDEAIYLDVGDADESVIVIQGGTWTRTSGDIPVLFRRTSLSAPFVDPCVGGELDLLWESVNVAVEDRPLVIAFLISALIQPDVPKPILALFAEQGSGKSTATRKIVDLIDPSPVPLKKTPRDAETWTLMASASWVVALDNLSKVPEWLSDSLCRASTGDGDVKRTLYTDDGLSIVKFNRCVIANGIDVGAHRGDLAERLINAELLRIPSCQRRSEKDLNDTWEITKPIIFGALLDLAAKVHLHLPSVALVSHPRMADFAQVLAAVDSICGTEGLERYLGKAALSAQDTLSADPFIERILLTITATFSGGATELLRRCQPEEISWRQPLVWPKNSRAVTGILRRNAPAMRSLGWGVEDDGGKNRDGIAKWTLTPPVEAERTPPIRSN
ncbi:ATP-binding protein [Rhodococcus sp. BP-332]|uniref:ATP-binding protein n=1 Tax=Rhodococcus sp. BP-332 TaxID=2739447 RepID=UPI001C9B9B3B|nr:ATP-binding protein [Rhodococcus sp. BP-332]MBY6678337.1 ATP-binding protein [Rhodococcus sp. BP-332]